MIFRQKFLEGIRSGSITLAFRKWKRPTVRAGGTLLTPVGQLSILAVDAVDPAKISARDARNAGFDSREQLFEELEAREAGIIYRIKLGGLSADPRIALRASVPTSDADLLKLQSRLTRLDSHSTIGPWTSRVLRLIAENPAVRAADLCKSMGQERDSFKVNVRKLKRLGLTESLDVGYRLSPRGKAVLKYVSR